MAAPLSFPQDVFVLVPCPLITTTNTFKKTHSNLKSIKFETYIAKRKISAPQ